jgi:hypothetical protein
MEQPTTPVDSRAIEPAGEGSGHVFGALAVGLGAALVSALAWYLVVVLTSYQLGLIAIGVGFLVGTGVVAGSGGRRGLMLQAMAVTITLVAMVAAEFLIARHFAVAALASEGTVGVPWLLPPGLMVSLVIDSLRQDPLTLVFWAIALWTAFRLPGRQTA